MHPLPGSPPQVAVACALESLVVTVSVLDGGRAAALLGCLADPHRPAALRILARIGRLGRAGRHAALASAFRQAGPGVVRAPSIPGALGAELRNQLAPGGALTGAPGAGAMERWARRLALELGVLDGDDG
ncbi:MAG: hypothetical protein ACXU81_13450, partial [Myxococcaceae bacterium]